MANIKPKVNGFYKDIITKTEIDECGKNLILFSIDNDLRNINYVISKDLYKELINKIMPLFENNVNTINEVSKVLEEDIYKIYKTKVSKKRVPQLLLNSLVLNKLMYSDNFVDYELKVSKKKILNFINKI